MSIKSIEQDFFETVSAKVSLSADGAERFRVFSPFMFEDGDHLAIVLKKDLGRWVLSDEGHTYMHLTYDIDERALHRGTRREIILKALSMFGVEDRCGELILEVQDGGYGDALYSFIQALLKIADVSHLSRERVQSTFMDDFRAVLHESVPVPRMNFNWSHPEHDPDSMYTVDCRINGMREPLLVHALSNDDRVRDTTIVLQQFKSWEMSFRSLAIFQNQQAINGKVLTRFNAVCEKKQFPSLDQHRKDIGVFLYRSIMNASEDSNIAESV